MQRSVETPDQPDQSDPLPPTVGFDAIEGLDPRDLDDEVLHAAVHGGAVENEGDDPKHWKITVAGRRPEPTGVAGQRVRAIDARVQAYRMERSGSPANTSTGKKTASG